LNRKVLAQKRPNVPAPVARSEVDGDVDAVGLDAGDVLQEAADLRDLARRVRLIARSSASSDWRAAAEQTSGVDRLDRAVDL
jgi:hypothetical protein